MIHRLKFIFFVIYFSDCTRQGLTATPQKAIGTYQMMENNKERIFARLVMLQIH